MLQHPERALLSVTLHSRGTATHREIFPCHTDVSTSGPDEAMRLTALSRNVRLCRTQSPHPQRLPHPQPPPLTRLDLQKSPLVSPVHATRISVRSSRSQVTPKPLQIGH